MLLVGCGVTYDVVLCVAYLCVALGLPYTGIVNKKSIRVSERSILERVYFLVL